jgi:hypothetical protein
MNRPKTPKPSHENRGNGPKSKSSTHNPDHARRTHVPALADPEIEARLDALVKPVVFAEMHHYRQLGLRNRLLNLPVMVGVVLTLLWRRVPGVCTLVRMLEEERMLWSAPVRVSQPALSERFLTFPADLFQNVFKGVIEGLPARIASRNLVQPGAA